MKLNKKQIGLVAAIACILLLIVLMLTMCSGYGGHQGDPSQPSQATEDATVETEETKETTEPSEATEETEETTEATEETTAPTTGGNTRPGGSGGYVPDYSGGNEDNDEDTDEDENNGPTVETAPDAGSSDSPYIETVTKYPDQITTILIPTGNTIFYHIYGADDGVLTIEDPEALVIYQDVPYTPDQNGVISIPFQGQGNLATAAEEDGTTQAEVKLPQVIRIGTLSTAPKAFKMSFHAPVGDARNPEVLKSEADVVTVNTRLAAGDQDGYTYSYTVEKDCRLNLKVDSATKNVPYDIIVTVGDVQKKLSEVETPVVALAAEEDAAAAEQVATEKILTMDLAAGDKVTIQVIVLAAENGTYPALDIKFQCQFEDTSGTKENPIVVSADMPILTDPLKPKKEIYYGIFGAGGMILTVEDPDAYVIVGEEKWEAVDGVVTGELAAGNPREPIVIGIGNAGETEKSFTVNFAFKPGSMMNPVTLVVDEINTAMISAGNHEGYWFTWTAEKEGILSLALPDTNWMYQINNETTSVYGDAHFCDDEEVLNPAETEVAAGDTLSIMVNTYDPANPNEVAAGEIEIYAMFSAKPGSIDNPFYFTEETNTVQVAPGTPIYFNQVLSGVAMTVTGEGSFKVSFDGVDYLSENGVVTFAEVNGNFREPVLTSLTNEGTEEVTYTITFVYPEGSKTNPRFLELMGEYTVGVRGDDEGYFFNWTPNTDGEFTISMKGNDWIYVVNNLTTETFGEIHRSDDEEVVSTVTIPVVAWENYEININTASRQGKDVVVEFEFYDPTYGTQENHASLFHIENVLSVRPGEVIYADVIFNNVTMTVAGPDPFALTFKGIEYVSENGVVVIHGVDADRFAPLLMELTNLGETKANYTVSFASPLGSYMNPHEITQMTEYTVSVVGDGEGYFFTWKAPEDGIFTITMLSDDWTCSAYNFTTGIGGDIQISGSAESRTQYIEVSADDEIQVNIGTQSRQDKEVTLAFDSYDPTFGAEDNPIRFTEMENTFIVRPGVPLYCDLYHNGVIMTVTGDVTVTLDGKGYPTVGGVVTVDKIKADRFKPAKLILTATGNEKTECTVSFAYPVGAMDNPEEITVMGVYNTAVSDDGMGYFYTWTAQEDGQFVITMLEDDWIYLVNNSIYYSNSGDPASKAVDVVAGDVVEINIGTASGKPKNVPVEFAFLTAAEVLENQIFKGTYTPEPFELLPEEIQKMTPMDITQKYTLSASVAGIYRLEDTSDTLMLLDFTDDTYLNLAELVESTELWIPVVQEDGTTVYQQCNDLLQAYIDCAWVQEVSEEVTRTLYPLTEDLEFILKTLGQEYGWFDAENEGYLFEVEVDEEDPDTAVEWEEETLWLFSSYCVQFVAEEEPVADATEN